MSQQPSNYTHQYNWSGCFPESKKALKCTGGTITGPKHCPRHSWQNVNQFTPTNIIDNVLWSVWQKLCQYWQHRTSYTHRAEPIENALMVDPIKGCSEINLHDPSLLPTLQFTLHWMGHITGTQNFPISKLGCWKHTTAFHKSSKSNRLQTLKHLRQYWCYGNRSVIRNRGLQWTLRNWGDIGLSPASRETTKTNKHPEHCTKTGATTSAVFLRKRGNIPNDSVPPLGSNSNNIRLTSLDLKAKVVRLGDGCQVRCRSRVYRRWVSCLMSKACLHWSSNRGLSLLHTRTTLVGT